MPYFYQGRAPDVRHGARALDRRRRHVAPASAPARRWPIPGSKACSSTSSRSTRKASSTRRSTASSRTTSAFPESSLGDMKSQMAACRLAARRMDELFDKYGQRHHARGDRADLRRDRAEVPQRGGAAAGRRLRGRGRRSTTTACARASRCRIHVKVTINGGDMTIDLSGCSAERKAGDQFAHLAGARVAYKALTGPLDPVNEGSFRALKVIIPEGNIMMARYPGADGGLERHRADGGRHHRHGAGAGDAGPRAGRPSRAARRRGGVLRRASEDQAALRGAEHRGRRLGRPAVRGRRVGDGLGLPGRRAQRLDRGHRAEVPGAGRRPRAAARIPAAPASIAAASASTCGCATWSRAAGISSRRGAANCPPWGLWGGTRRRARRLSAAAAGRERFQAHGRRATSRCRSTPRRSCAPAAAAAGAIRSSATPPWCAPMSPKSSFPDRRPGALWGGADQGTCRSTRPRPRTLRARLPVGAPGGGDLRPMSRARARMGGR